MQNSKLILSVILVLGLIFTGFQCASTEITSARLYIQQKNYDRALEALQTEVTKNPKSDEGYFLLGFVYAEKEMYPEMMNAFNKSLAISNKYKSNIEDSRKYHWVNLFNAGATFYQRGNNTEDADSAKLNFDRSIERFENAILVEPDSTDTYKNLAFVYITTNRLDDAMKPLQTLINKERSVDGYRFLGEIIYDKGNRLRTKYENTGNVQDSIAAQEYFLQVISLLEEGRKYHPGDGDILLLLSNSYISANKIEVAVDAFREGVIKEPDNEYYRFNYGVLLLGADKYEEAEEQFKKAIEINPEYENAIYNLAVTYVRWGSFINKQAEDKGETSPEYKAKFQAALPYLEKLVQMKADDVAIWELLGRVYAILDMQQDAENAYKKADSLRR